MNSYSQKKRCPDDGASVIIHFFRKLFLEQPKNQFIWIGKLLIKKCEKVIFSFIQSNVLVWTIKTIL
jgi:hypothetical protein